VHQVSGKERTNQWYKSAGMIQREGKEFPEFIGEKNAGTTWIR
jgi:hypothetical protein